MQVAADLPHDKRHIEGIRALYRRTGVKTRYSVLLEDDPIGLPGLQAFYPRASNEQDRGPSTSQRMARYEARAPDLAQRACRVALDDADIAAGGVTHLITVSCTGFSAPGVDLGLIEKLGLPTSVARTHLGFMGCHGALNALRVAAAFASGDPEAHVLVCAVELCSLHHQYSNAPQQIVANALFSDGAAAAVVRQSGNDRYDNGIARWRMVSQKSVVFPAAADQMSWRIGDHGFQMTLSPRVPALIRESLCPWLSCWLKEQGKSVASVESWAIHPGGPRILTACAAAAGFDSRLLAPSQQVLADYGNMSSPTVLFILDRLRDAEANSCVTLAFGPGLTIEAALLER